MSVNNASINFSPSVRNLGVIFGQYSVLSTTHLQYLQNNLSWTAQNQIYSQLPVDGGNPNPYLHFRPFTASMLQFSPDPKQCHWKAPKNSKQCSASCLSVFQIWPNSPLCDSLLWLPVSKRIDYKISCLCNSVLTGTGPRYLTNLSYVYVPSRQLRSSSDDRIFRFLRFKARHNGPKSISFQSLCAWKKLSPPHSVKHSATTSTWRYKQ